MSFDRSPTSSKDTDLSRGDIPFNRVPSSAWSADELSGEIQRTSSSEHNDEDEVKSGKQKTPQTKKRRSKRSSSTAGIFNLDPDDDPSQDNINATPPVTPSASTGATDILPRSPSTTTRTSYLHAYPSSSSNQPSSHVKAPISSTGNTLGVLSSTNPATPLTSSSSSRQGRSLFDTTPSFSSPLAHASTFLPEQLDDLSVDHGITNASSASKASRLHSAPASKQSSPVLDKGLAKISPTLSNGGSSSPSSPKTHRERKSSQKSTTDEERIGTQNHSGAGLGARKSSSAMGPPLALPRRSAGQNQANANISTVRLPDGDASSHVRALLQRARSINSNRATSGASEDSSNRSVSGSSTGSGSAGISSPPGSWNAPSHDVSSTDSNAGPTGRTRSSTYTPSSSAHRRARSLGGAFLSDAVSPVGGPDGVDPNLIAAIRAGDATIPGGSNSLDSTGGVSRSPVSDSHRKTTSLVPSSRVTSSPSTPVSAGRFQPRKGEHLTVGPDTRALAASYPSFAVPPADKHQMQGQDQSGGEGSIAASEYDNESRAARDQATAQPTAHSAQNDSQLGLGIGLEGDSEAKLKVPSGHATPRSSSPLSLDDSAAVWSSGQSSPYRIQKTETVRHETPSQFEELFTDTHNRLSVRIPAPDVHVASIGPLSALPAVNYHLSTSPQLTAARQTSKWDTDESSILQPPASYHSRTNRAFTMQHPPAELHGEGRSDEHQSSPDKAPISTSYRQPSMVDQCSFPQSTHGTPMRSSDGRSNARRMSVVPSPHGIDEYARIIVQSRNAKMQKWRTLSRQPTQQGSSEEFALKKDEAMDRKMNAATPNVSPNGSESGDLGREHQPSATENEIEWVDWLDEYRKMKEAKLRIERNEDIPQEESADLHAKLQLLSLNKNVGDSENHTVNQSHESSPVSASKHVSQVRGPISPSKRPSDQMQSGHAEPTRSWSGNLSLSPNEESASYALGRRPSTFVEKTRNLSLSPITSRIGSGASQQSNAPVGGSKRRKLLGGKLEAWWGAVKSGFGNSPGVTSNYRPNDQTPKPDDNVTFDHLRRVNSVFGTQSYGASHVRAQTHRQPSEARSIQTLRATSSVQNLNALDTQDLSSKKKGSPVEDTKQSSTRPRRGTLLGHHNSAEKKGERCAEKDMLYSEQTRSKEAVVDVTSNIVAVRNRKMTPHLSLQLDKGLSAFNTSPSDRLHGSSTQSSPADQMASSSKSSPHASSRVQSSPKTVLSDAWKPASKAREDTNQGVGENRGRSSKREKGIEPFQSASKDITVDSIRKHIRQRLATSKDNCDRELRKVVLSINNYVEDRMMEQQKQDALETTTQVLADMNLGDDSSGKGSHIDSLEVSEMSRSSSVSLAELKDPDETPQPRDQEDFLGVPTPRRPSQPPKRDYVLPPPPRRPSNSLTRSLSKTNHNRSRDLTSTSTSRSHSPLPDLSSTPTDSPQFSPARRVRPLPNDDTPLEPHIAPLQELVCVAMDILDTSIHTLTSREGICQEVIAHIQELGKIWEEHPKWPGRGWYVKLLLAVAGLSRVVEWWEAEKGFWNFEDDEVDEDDSQPLRFGFGNPFGQAGISDDMTEAAPPFALSRTVASRSPVRLVRSTALAQSARTPSQHSSVANSPALEPLDRRAVSDSDQARIAQASLAASSMMQDEAEQSEIVNDIPESVKQRQNVLMELSLDGERFLYLSPAWQHVIGTDPATLFDQPIRNILAPDDADTFDEATMALQADDAHTVEAAFRLQVDPSVVPEAHMDVTYYQEMEGKGMLMHDRQSGAPSHTMWVFKPTAVPEVEADLAPGQHKLPGASGDTSVVGGGQLPLDQQAILSTEPLLCRICERDIPTWFFEKHSEICNEIHRLEMEITENNEGLVDLRKNVREMITQLEEGPEGCEYNGVALSTPPVSLEPPSALEAASRSLALPHPNQASIRKAHLRALHTVADILRTASTISTPATKDDSDPIERQRLLSPESESKIVQIRNWKVPTLHNEDLALEMLFSDVDAIIKRKLSSVNRMLNTIVYVETVRMEWETRVEAALDEQQGSDEEQDEDQSSVSQSHTAHDHGESQENPSRNEGMAKTQNVDDELNADNSALLLDQYESEGNPGSTALSAREDLREDDIPGVEASMGGSAMDPIPIPATSSVTSRVRRMHRDMSAVSSSSGDIPSSSSLQAPNASLLRRESLLGFERGQLNTPPLSPRHSPRDVSRPKDRRISHSMHRGSYSPFIGSTVPLSPRIPATAPSSRPTASSIKDFDIIKPISKGAFGSVFLAKKHTTGDYYAIKVLKKSDMIAKNQITNVKAERMILMTQTQSPFVVKLFFTFQSSDNLYLVMEYLPGGDCASLVKTLGGITEDWARRFLAEVVNGLEMLHQKGVVHRDMKPDNLLIDQHGHLKLTDFGLSKIGLLGRQTRQQQQQVFAGRSSTTGPSKHGKKDSVSANSQTETSSSPSSTQAQRTALGRSPIDTPSSGSFLASQPFFVGTPTHPRGRIMSTSTDVSDSSGSEGAFVYGQSLRHPNSGSYLDSPRLVFGSQTGGTQESLLTAPQGSSGSGGQLKKFVGTPDYLAPESILGLGMDDAAVDWWALGVILYEFLYGYPPFHAETPEKVFDNILSRNISWHDEDVECSSEARDLMESLICTDRKRRLGSRGAQEIKDHPFFAGIDWTNLTAEDGPFVPQISDPESTDYFDLRGAVYQNLHEEETQALGMHEFAKAVAGNPRDIHPSHPPQRRSSKEIHNKDISEGQGDDFGSFSYKNLPVLKQANDEVIKKMRGDQLNSMSSAMMDQQQTQQQSHSAIHQRNRSVSGVVGTPSSHRNSAALFAPGGPPSPTTSISSLSSLLSKSTAPTSPSGYPYLLGSAPHAQTHLASNQHRRRPSELSSASGGVAPGSSAANVSGNGVTPHNGMGTMSSLMDRKRLQLSNEDEVRRGSLPARLRTASVGGASIPDRPALPWQMQGAAESPVGIIKDSSSKNEDIPSSDDGSSGGLGLLGAPHVSQIIQVEQVNCFIAEDNPIAQKMLEMVLGKLGCVVHCVRNGAEALRLAMGEEKFSVLFIDLTLPIVSGQDVARMIKSTRNINSNSPIIALATNDRTGVDNHVKSSHNGTDSVESLFEGASGIFDGMLNKPIDRLDVFQTLTKLGFRTVSGNKSSREEPTSHQRRATIAHSGVPHHKNLPHDAR